MGSVGWWGVDPGAEDLDLAVVGEPIQCKRIGFSFCWPSCQCSSLPLLLSSAEHPVLGRLGRSKRYRTSAFYERGNPDLHTDDGALAPSFPRRNRGEADRGHHVCCRRFISVVAARNSIMVRLTLHRPGV